jgi:hypothetical protein
MLKKIFASATMLLALVAVLHVSVATHYCGGMFASSLVSLTGETATCGMESDHDVLQTDGLIIHSHCCDNEIKYLGVSGNYFPTFTSIPDLYDSLFHIAYIEINNTLPTAPAESGNVMDESPPGTSSWNSVELSSICIFRI